MNPSALIANTLWLGSSLPGFMRFRRALRHPENTQRRLLRQYLVRNADTAFGKAYGFGKMQNHRDFARQVPLMHYDGLQPWIAREAKGEHSVLTKDAVTHLIPTSGSTAGRKLIPFTAELQREFNAAIGPWIVDLVLRNPSICLGSSYWSITPTARALETESSVVPIGFDEDSNYLGGGRKRILNALMAAPPELRFIEDIEKFRYVTLLCLIRQPDLRLMSIWHPSFLMLLLDALIVNWSDLINDVREGGCKYGETIPSAIVAALPPWPKRADQLGQADPTNPKTSWPRLQLISCWGDGHAAGAMSELQRRFPDVQIQSKGLLATEAFVTIPFRGFCPLAICSHFFEFIDDEGRVHLAHELVQDAEYEVVITTGGGLYRYRLGDRVKVTGFLLSTPSLKFMGRHGNHSDHFGEKLSEAFVGRAIQSAVSPQTKPPCFAMLAPEAATDGTRYILFMEGEADKGLAERLDEELKQNPHYRYCRELGQLRSPEVFLISDGGYEAYVNHEMSRGKRLGEIKPSPLSTETGWTKRFRMSTNGKTSLRFKV